MNRILCLALIVAFAFVQSLQLHGHLQHDADAHTSVLAHSHIHSDLHHHGGDLDDADHMNDQAHQPTVEVDLLGIALTQDNPGTHPIIALVAFWLGVFFVLWVGTGWLPPPIPPFHFRSPPLLRPSPRAPPF
jgi:hypothetical protein